MTTFLITGLIIGWVASGGFLLYTIQKHKGIINDVNQQLSESQKRTNELQEAYDTEHGNFVSFVDNFEKKVQTEVELRAEQIRTEVEEEYDTAIKEQIEELGTKVSEVDKMIEEAVSDIHAKNTLYLSCSCNKDRKIPVPIDFTTENRFSCDKCGSVYRVELSAYPVLLSNVSNNRVIANIFKGEK